MRWQEKAERSGFFERNREEQVLYWLHETIRGLLLTKFLENEGIQKRIREIENRVASGSVNPITSAAELAGAVQVILSEREARNRLFGQLGRRITGLQMEALSDRIFP